MLSCSLAAVVPGSGATSQLRTRGLGIMADLTEFRDQTYYGRIPSNFPPIALFNDVADAENFEDVFAVQAMTNPRLQEQVGNRDLVPKGERVFGMAKVMVVSEKLYSWCYLKKRVNDSASRAAYVAEMMGTNTAIFA